MACIEARDLASHDAVSRVCRCVPPVKSGAPAGQASSGTTAAARATCWRRSRSGSASAANVCIFAGFVMSRCSGRVNHPCRLFLALNATFTGMHASGPHEDSSTVCLCRGIGARRHHSTRPVSALALTRSVRPQASSSEFRRPGSPEIRH